MNRGEQGSTLVEVLVGSAIAVLVLFAVADMDMSAWRYQKVDEVRFAMRAETQTAMDQVLAEARRALRATVADPAVLTLELPAGTVTYRWNQASAQLLREGPDGQRAVGRQLAAVRFALEAGGRTVRVDLTARSADGGEFPLTSRASLRVATE